MSKHTTLACVSLVLLWATGCIPEDLEVEVEPDCSVEHTGPTSYDVGDLDLDGDGKYVLLEGNHDCPEPVGVQSVELNSGPAQALGEGGAVIYAGEWSLPAVLVPDGSGETGPFTVDCTFECIESEDGPPDGCSFEVQFYGTVVAEEAS